MKPILFNTEMVEAILDGRKTQTRRVANHINPYFPCGIDEEDFAHEFIRDDFIPGTKFTGFVCRRCGYGVSPPHCRTPVGSSFIRPPYQIGDCLYVRETWAPMYRDDTSNDVVAYMYKADDWKGKEEYDRRYPDGKDYMWEGRWRPSIHMPKEAARIFLRVTDVSVERLQDIKMADMAAEGVIPETVTGGQWQQWQHDYMKPAWDSTVKPKYRGLCGWDANPWVWVFSFERINREEEKHGHKTDE